MSECANRGDVTLQCILQFITGSSRIPATGFEDIPSIRFTDDERLPTVSTCAMSVTFSRSMGLLSLIQRIQKQFGVV